MVVGDGGGGGGIDKGAVVERGNDSCGDSFFVLFSILIYALFQVQNSSFIMRVRKNVNNTTTSKGSKPMYLNLYHIFDSILAFSLSLDNYLKSNQPDLQTLQTERHME